MKSYENINSPLPVLRLTEEQILDYIKCPNYFYLKYNSKIPFNNLPSFKDLIQKIIDAYMIKIFNGQLLSIDKVKKLWDKASEEYPNVLSSKRVLDGIGIMTMLDRYCHNNKLLIADINSPYQINFSHNVIVTGNLGIIRLNDKQLELFVVETSQKKPEQILLDMSFKYTLQIYAINKMSPGVNINCLRVYHVKSNSEYTTYRTQKDYDRMEKIIAGVSKAIRNEIFYPREDFTCPQCVYKNYCGYI